MNKVLVAMFLMFAIAYGAIAQDQKGHQGRKKHSKEYVRDLNLSEQQQQQMKAARESFRKEMAELRKNDQITVKEMRERRSALAKEHKQAIEKILTEDQKKKLAERKNSTKRKFDGAGRRAMADLNLTDAQKNQMKELNHTFRQKIAAIKADASLNEEGKTAKMQAVAKEHKEAVKNVLTLDQTNKLEEMKKRRTERKTVK